MTVGQLIELAKGREDLELVIRKRDKWQLSCHTTVPVKNAYCGFDWTFGQFILEPVVDLVTSAEEIDKGMREQLKDYSNRLTMHLSVAAKIAMLLKDIPDGDLRDKIHDLLKEIK